MNAFKNELFGFVGGMCLELSVETVERLAWVSESSVVFQKMNQMIK